MEAHVSGFHFNEHPVTGLVLTILTTTISLCLNVVHGIPNIGEGLKELASLGQILACTMTIYVGYRTLKKTNAKNDTQ